MVKSMAANVSTYKRREAHKDFDATLITLDSSKDPKMSHEVIYPYYCIYMAADLPDTP